METREYNGVTYQRSAPGEPWRRVSGGRIIPKSETTQRKEGADADRAQTEAELAAIKARTAEALAQAELAKARADAAAASANATKSVTETAALPTPPTAEVKSARNELATDSILEKLTTARRQIGEGWSTGNVAGREWFQGIPIAGQNSADLAATLEGITGSLINDTLKDFRAQSATGASGFGSLTEREAQRLAAAVASMRQTQSDDALLASLAAVEKHYRNLMALKNNEDPRDPQVAARYGIAVDDRDDAMPAMPSASNGSAPNAGGSGIPPASRSRPSMPSGGGGQSELTSEGKWVPDPALRGVNATVLSMIRAGRSEREIRNYLDRVQPGLGRARGLSQAISYYNQNPNGKPPTIDLEQRFEPASGFNKALGDAALWEVPGTGFSPGAAVIGAADMLSMGTIDNFADNPDMARAVMRGVQERNPGSFLTGQVAGGVGSGLGAEAALARAGLGQVATMRGGDFLMGAGYGAGSADQPYESRLGGGVEGGLFGLGGGMDGRGLSSATGKLVRGVDDPARQMLSDADVPMTVGQLLGGTAQRTEDRLAGLPFVGDLIMRRRREGVEGFNRAAFDEGLAPIGATTGGVIGEQGIDIAQRRVGDAYTNALGGAQVTVDQPFTDDLVNAVNYLRGIPRVGEEVTDSIGNIVNPTYFGAGDTLSGVNMQPMVRELRGLRASYAPDPLGNRVGQGIGQVEDAVTGMFRRQAPDVMPAYELANQAFRNEEVLRGAVDRARAGSRSGEPGMFMPSQLLDSAAANSGKFGNARGTTRQPFFDLARAGQQVLPSQIADSGTAGRLALPAIFASGGYAASEEGEGAAGAGGGLAAGATIAALLSAPYSRASRDVIAKALLADRNPAVQQIGQELIDRSRIAGLLASAPLVASVGAP